MPDRFIHLRKGPTGYTVRGEPRVRLGHRIGTDDGIFLEWDWDGAVFTLRADRYALYPLYYFQKPGEICFATSLARLIEEGAPRTLDDTAIASFLRFGSFLGEETALSGVRYAPPGARIGWDGTRLEVSGHLPLVATRPLSRAQAIDGYIDVMRAAIRRRLPEHEDFVLPLSGGRDSRQILFEIHAAGRRPKTCLTARHYPPRPNFDSEIAAYLCNRLNLPLAVLEAPRPRVAAEIRKNRLTDFATAEHAWGLAIADFLAQGAQASFDGINGGILFGRHTRGRKVWQTLTRGASPDEVLDVMQQRGFNEVALSRVLGPAFHKRFPRELARQRLSEEFQRYQASGNPITSFYFWSRACRHTNLFTLGLMPEIVIYCPFFDPEVLDFALSLPPEMAFDATFQGEAINKAFPEHAAIPFEPLHYRLKPVPPWQQGRLALDLARCFRRHRDSEWIDMGFAIPRLLRAAVSGNMGYVAWWRPLSVLPLLQLEAALAGH